jgi:hypothetical protein
LELVLFTEYYPGDQSRRKRWTGHVAHVGKRKVAHRIFMGKPDGKLPLGNLDLERGSL